MKRTISKKVHRGGVPYLKTGISKIRKGGSTSIQLFRDDQTTAAPIWHYVDAHGRSVGRLANQIARLLQGKHKPTYNPSLCKQTGDFVVVTNAEKVVFTGNKWMQKRYTWHTRHAGGLIRERAKDMLRKHPDHILYRAVKGMLPSNQLRTQRLKRLKVYVGPDHPHQHQISQGRQFDFKIKHWEPDENTGETMKLPERIQNLREEFEKDPFNALKKHGGMIMGTKNLPDGTTHIQSAIVEGTEVTDQPKKYDWPVNSRMKRMYRKEQLDRTLAIIKERNEVLNRGSLQEEFSLGAIRELAEKEQDKPNNQKTPQNTKS